MKRYFIFLVFIIFVSFNAFSQVHTTYLWHLQQPIYWPEKGQSNPYHYQTCRESYDIKMSGGNNYGTGTSHPTNNLQEIFSVDDRKNVYQHGIKNCVAQLTGYPEAGGQVNYSGCLIENVDGLANADYWGYYSGWNNNYIEARGWQTSGGFPRLDIVGFTFHHALSPLITERAFRKELQAHKLIYGNTFGTTPLYTKGYWPAECCFTERNIKVLVEEGFEWSIVANSHLARTLNDYPLHYGTNGCNISPPNKADKVSTNGNHWWNGQIDGRGGEFAAPYCYQAHKAQYIDPATGTQYLIDIVLMADLLSYRDGYSQQGTGDIETYIKPYDDPSHPSIVLFAHDGDNAWGGGSSYYFEAVPSFVAAATNAGMVPTTIQQFLHDHPVPSNDIVHVEDGGWVNAANDWGHPQFINWLWPIYDSQTYEFNPNGWTEDFRNWAVIIAIDNYACMAEDLEGGTDINDIVYPSASSSEAELAWHFYMPALTSGYMYYGTAEDMEVKQTIAGNNAIYHAQNVINNYPGVDNTPPSVFIPQRFPYNPGGKEFGPIYGYQEFTSSKDFTVWTLAYDVSGVQNAVLKYRVDFDGVNTIDNYENDTYTGGSGVSAWNSINMSIRTIDPSYNAGNPDIDFFVLPTAIADLYYAEITGLKDTLVDYYVEVTDNKGNTFKTPIQHVWVGNESGSNPNAQVYWSPQEPTMNQYVTITCTYATGSTLLHWGVNSSGNSWQAPNQVYWPANSSLFQGTGPAVQTPFTDEDNDGVYTVVLGPFNNAAQVVNNIAFVIHDGDYWDNNGGLDYHITINNNVNDNPTGSNEVINILINQTYNFNENDFTFNGVGGATFAGIRVVNTVTKGYLKYNNVNVTPNQVCSDVSLLTFTPFTDETGSPYTTFTFKVIDSQGRESDNNYTFRINVTSLNPTGADASITMMQDNSYTFSISNFPFTGAGGATFAGIKLMSDVDKGTLLYDGSSVSVGNDFSNVTLLTFEPDAGEYGTPYTSFNFKVKDNEGRYSDDSYTMTINVLENSQPAGVSWFPENPTSNDQIIIVVSLDENMGGSSMLHWGVNDWQSPNTAYWPAGTTLFNGTGPAVQSPFSEQTNDLYTIQIGPFNNSAQVVNEVNFVIYYGGGNWNNNGGNDWKISITQIQDVEEVQNNNVIIYPNPFVSYAVVDMTKEIGNYTVNLIDVSGNLITSTKIIAPQKFYLNRSELQSGIYFLQFIENEKQTSFYKTIILN